MKTKVTPCSDFRDHVAVTSNSCRRRAPAAWTASTVVGGQSRWHHMQSCSSAQRDRTQNVCEVTHVIFALRDAWLRLTYCTIAFSQASLSRAGRLRNPCAHAHVLGSERILVVLCLTSVTAIAAGPASRAGPAGDALVGLCYRAKSQPPARRGGAL